MLSVGSFYGSTIVTDKKATLKQQDRVKIHGTYQGYGRTHLLHSEQSDVL